MASTDFTADAFRALIGDLLNRGYQVRDFADAESAARHLILRHDVDFSLEIAAEMGAIEAEMRVAATYFVLPDSEFYNPRSPAARAAMACLLADGHRIGLHFDAAPWADDPEGLEKAADDDLAFLSDLIGAPVEIISLHRPAPHLVGSAAPVAGRPHTYMPCFTQDMGYCSDSRGGWHHGHPLDHPAVAEGRCLHLLIHPIWWMVPGESPHHKVARLLERRADRLDAEAARNCAAYRPTRNPKS